MPLEIGAWILAGQMVAEPGFAAFRVLFLDAAPVVREGAVTVMGREHHPAVTRQAPAFSGQPCENFATGPPPVLAVDLGRSLGQNRLATVASGLCVYEAE